MTFDEVFINSKGTAGGLITINFVSPFLGQVIRNFIFRYRVMPGYPNYSDFIRSTYIFSSACIYSHTKADSMVLSASATISALLSEQIHVLHMLGQKEFCTLQDCPYISYKHYREATHRNSFPMGISWFINTKHQSVFHSWPVREPKAYVRVGILPWHTYRGILTVAYLPWHTYRDILTVAYLPWHTYRDILTVAYLPWHTYRGILTVTYLPWHTYRDILTVAYLPWHTSVFSSRYYYFILFYELILIKHLILF